MSSRFRFLIVFLAAAGIMGHADALPLGLYTTSPQEKSEAVEVGPSGFFHSGLTLRPGTGWRLADPIVPLDFLYLKPWIARPGTGIQIRLRRLRFAAESLEVAAIRDRPPGARGLTRLPAVPFHTTNGPSGLRVPYGNGREILFTATYFSNQRGDLFSCDAVATTESDRRAVDHLLRTMTLRPPARTRP